MHFISPKINLAETVESIQMLKEDSEKFKFPEGLRKKKKPPQMDRQDKTLYMLSLKERTEFYSQ